MEAAEIRDRKKNLVQPLPQQPITITTTEGEKYMNSKQEIRQKANEKLS